MKSDKPIKGWTFKKYKDGSVIATTLGMILALAAVFVYPGVLTGVILALVGGLWGLVLYFFRNPDRDVLLEPGLVIGPCDGTVADITHLREEQYLNADVVRVGIFLSVFNVHVQRAPLAGEVVFVEHNPGKFLPAFDPGASTENENIAMVLKTKFGEILVKQISGILARRCINFATVGDVVQTGQRFGLIKFGSRVELYLPPEVELLVSVGDQVRGGLTRVAQMPGAVNDDEF